MKMSVAASTKGTFGFSVKDILDLPSNIKTARSSSSATVNSGQLALSSLTGTGDGDATTAACLPPPPPSTYHPAAAALYYSAACDNPYARWLPPSDMFTYSTPLRK